MDDATASLIGTGAQVGLNIGGDLWSSQKDIDLYREMREYNKPVNQVWRMKEAGLNPALMYGSGNVANVVGPAPKYNSPKIDRNPLMDYQQVQNMDRQRMAMDAQINLLKKQADLVQGQAESANYDAGMKAMEFKTWAQRFSALGGLFAPSDFDKILRLVSLVFGRVNLNLGGGNDEQGKGGGWKAPYGPKY